MISEEGWVGDAIDVRALIRGHGEEFGRVLGWRSFVNSVGK